MFRHADHVACAAALITRGPRSPASRLSRRVRCLKGRGTVILRTARVSMWEREKQCSELMGKCAKKPTKHDVEELASLAIADHQQVCGAWACAAGVGALPPQGRG